MNCPFCDSTFELYTTKCATCSLCVTCCYKENNGICSPEEIAEYENWRETTQITYEMSYDATRFLKFPENME